MTEFISNPYVEDIITKLAQDEVGKRQYYRPVYSLHKWWARRPGALFRSIILLAAKPELSATLFHRVGNDGLAADSPYFQGHDLSDLIILDPFMGGGTTLVEANRMGARVIGGDINPVSYWIVRETLKPLALGKLQEYFHALEQEAGTRIRALYNTTCTICGATADGLYHFWVRYVPCPECGERIYLFKHHLLNKGFIRSKHVSASNPATIVCPICHTLNESTIAESCRCRYCGVEFDPQKGSFNQGWFSCAHCEAQKISLIETVHRGQPIREKLIAIEYLCPRCRQRLYKAPADEDLAKVEGTTRILAANRDTLTYPRQEIPPGSSSARWRAHGYRYYHQVFSARQIVAFNYLFEAIRQIPEREYQAAFLTIFSNALEYNNMMTPYNYPHRKLHHLFNYHALPLTTMPVENVVWGAAEEGAGTFVNCYGRYIRAKSYCRRPFDKYKDVYGQVQTVYPPGERIAGQLVSSFAELARQPRGVWLHCGDSSHLTGLPDDSVDFIITDPPYFDNIHYSELSNFFYVWLAQFDLTPHFSTSHVDAEQEAIVNVGMEKDEELFRTVLTNVFREGTRVLKPQGLFIFTFHHTKWRAWWNVLQAIMGGGFCLVDYFPVVTEYKVNPHVRNKQALDMDLVLVCTHRSAGETKPIEQTRALYEQIAAATREKLSYEATYARLNENKLFLYYMGETLKVLSELPTTIAASYELFSDLLQQYRQLLDEVEELLVSLDRSADTFIHRKQALAEQLRLFEATVRYNTAET